MMTDSTFGTRLASERIRRGLTLEQVSSTLRIRPAILESLETGDFYHMPLKGHARNMVSSYARYLGLDPVSLTEQFLGEYHEFEERESRGATSSRRSSPLPDYHSAASETPSSSRLSSSRRRSSQRNRSQGMRSMWNKPIPASPQHQALERRSSADQQLGTDQQLHTGSSRRRASVASSEGDLQQRSSYDAEGRDVPSRDVPSRNTAYRNAPYRTASYRTAPYRNAAGRPSAGRTATGHGVSGNASVSASRNYGVTGNYTPVRPPLPSRVLGAIFKSPVTAIIALVIVLILLLVLWALAANSCMKKSDELVPASGAVIAEKEAIDPSTGLEIPELSDDLLPDPRYGPFQLTLEPVSGTAPWTEVTVDGQNVFAGMLESRMTWEVTDSCAISTGQPGNLTVTRGEVPVTWDINENGVGNLHLAVEERPANDRTTNAPTDEDGTNQTGEPPGDSQREAE
ncbi:MAG: helix-turn-helix domain-containing protein [Coriobacteriales bacterium]|jgi:cytoskeletal protein RodZ|nr:helix-turn-helix domain-containing protein [Coriobacteriales bacterium]